MNQQVSGQLKGEYHILLASDNGEKTLTANLVIDDQDTCYLDFRVIVKGQPSGHIYGTLHNAIREYDSWV